VTVTDKSDEVCADDHDPALDRIRRDIWSVKVRGNGFDEWCHERMFRSAKSAKRYRKGLCPMLGYALQSEVVHPADWVVDAYVLAGNTIYE
jgi:hypothetical protein